MAATRKSGRRKDPVPGSLTLKWQIPDARGHRTATRRPMTACTSCRMAKARCDGQKECRRCVTRGIRCRYGFMEDGPALSNEVLLRTASTTPRTSSAGPNLNRAEDLLNGAEDTSNPMPDDIQNWLNPNFGQAFDSFNPEDPNNNMNTNLHWIENDVPLIDSTTTQTQQLTGHSFPSGFDQSIDSLQPLSDLTSSGAQMPPLTDSAFIPMDISPSPSTGSQPSVSTLYASSDCSCRTEVADLLSQVTEGIKQRRTNEVYQKTQQIMQGCQCIIECTRCSINCMDLISLMAVFQQTEPCFQCVMKADPGRDLQMSHGGFDVPIKDSRLGKMLILNLIQQAHLTLDAIGDKGRTMLETQGCSASSFAITNMEYLEIVIKEFKDSLSQAAERIA